MFLRMWNYKPGEAVTSQVVPERILIIKKICYLDLNAKTEFTSPNGTTVAESALCVWTEGGIKKKKKIFLKDLQPFVKYP
ncbi:MAG: hypothetical protein V4642_04045 [Bacteroidota bacterium]